MNKFKFGFVITALVISSFGLGFKIGAHFYPQVLGQQTERKNTPEEAKEQPLREFNLQNLQTRQYQVSEINVEKVLGKFPSYTSYLFSYKTQGRKMTGQMNVPNTNKKEFSVIVLIRGYVEQDKYSTGEGTRPAAAAFAEQGYVTFAPDFFGFGGSDPEISGWQSRFEKPVNVVELIQSIRTQKTFTLKNQEQITINPEKLGLWGHSNGGQIALTTLEVLGEPIPTTLWAPVTAPFPYSILYFSDEDPDEGKSMRGSIAALEREYNLQEFSLTQYLNRLRGPIQLHHGTADDAAPKTWSDEFVQKINQENDNRKQTREERKKAAERKRQAELAASASAQTATTAATLENSKTLTTVVEAEDLTLLPLELNYFVYPGANHSLRPGWEKVVERDVSFFRSTLNP